MMAQQRRIGALARTGKFEERGEFSLSSRERFSYRLAHGDVLQDFHHRHAEQNVEDGKNTAQEQLFRDLGGKKPLPISSMNRPRTMDVWARACCEGCCEAFSSSNDSHFSRLR